MSKASVYEAKTENFIQPILDSMNFELVDVEYVKEGGMNYLRAYIDKEGGITVDDCEVVARQMNCLLYTSPSPRDRQKSRMPSSA